MQKGILIILRYNGLEEMQTYKLFSCVMDKLIFKDGIPYASQIGNAEAKLCDRICFNHLQEFFESVTVISTVDPRSQMGEINNE